jgi:hypothetical protein
VIAYRRFASTLALALGSLAAAPLSGCEETCSAKTEDISEADWIQEDVLDRLGISEATLSDPDFPLADSAFDCIGAESSTDTREGEFGFNSGCGFGQLSTTESSQGLSIVWERETGNLIGASSSDYDAPSGQCNSRTTYYGESPECETVRRYYCAPAEGWPGTGGTASTGGNSNFGGDSNTGGVASTGGTATTGGDATTGGSNAMGGLGGFGGAG